MWKDHIYDKYFAEVMELVSHPRCQIPFFFLLKKVIMQIKCEDEPLENLIKHIRIVYLNINNQIKEWTAEKPNNHHLLK